MMNEKGFPPRLWAWLTLDHSGIAAINVKSVRFSPSTEYISIGEHEALLKEAEKLSAENAIRACTTFRGKE